MTDGIQYSRGFSVSCSSYKLKIPEAFSEGAGEVTSWEIVTVAVQNKGKPQIKLYLSCVETRVVIWSSPHGPQSNCLELEKPGRRQV